MAALSLALAAGADMHEAAMIANFAAGVVVGKRGTATVTRAELERALRDGAYERRCGIRSTEWRRAPRITGCWLIEDSAFERLSPRRAGVMSTSCPAFTRVVGLIPARYASKRFPGKALADLCGKPLLQHVVERSAQAHSLSEVVVATDDSRIAGAVRGFGGKVEMTAASHPSGTDRIAEVARDLDCDLVVNIQGDEPLIVPAEIDAAVAPLLADPTIPMGTLACPLPLEQAADPNAVKVVVGIDGFALYFSRSPIPYLRDGHAGRGEPVPASISGCTCTGGMCCCAWPACRPRRWRSGSGWNSCGRWSTGSGFGW